MGQDWLKISAVTAPVFALMVGAGYYLWLDYQGDTRLDQNQANKEVFGNISYSSNNVKRKSNESVLWNQVSKEEILYYQDSIRTGPESYAVIKLRDGSVIELNENSLIVLEKNSDQLSVDFKTGDIRTKQSSRGLTFRVKNTTIQAQGADLKLRADSQKTAQVVVTKGKATLVDAQKNKSELGPESLLNIDTKGQTQTVSVPLTLNMPADKAQVVSSSSEAKLVFTWNVHDKNLREEFLEVSTDPNFIKERTNSVRAHQAGSSLLKRGKNYWRVGWRAPRNLANSESPLLYSETRTVSLVDDQRITLVYPGDGTVFETTPKENSVEFTWKAEGTPKVYVFEMSDSTSFKQIRQTHKLADTKFKAAGLKNGVYYWRVTALGPKNENMGQSSANRFEINFVLPMLPTLLKPDDSFSWGTQLPVRMEWKPVENVSRYRVTVSRDREAKQIVKTATVTHSPYAWTWNKPGAYYWTVESLDESDIALTRSQTRLLNVSAGQASSLISLSLPADQSEVNRERKEPIDPVSFEWRADKLQPTNFTLMISKTPGFEKFLKTENIQKNQVLVRLTEASGYYWKVVWIDPENPERTETSQTYFLKYGIPDGLPAPVLVDPIKDAVVKVPGKQVIELTWQPVAKAVKYRVVVERFDERINGRVPVVDQTVQETKFTTLPLPEGNYEWRVYSIDEKQVQGIASETRKLNLKGVEALMAPKLKPPEIK